MPGQAGAIGQIAQGATHEPCVTRHAGECGDLTVGGDAPAWNEGHHLPDPLDQLGLQFRPAGSRLAGPVAAPG